MPTKTQSKGLSLRQKKILHVYMALESGSIPAQLSHAFFKSLTDTFQAIDIASLRISVLGTYPDCTGYLFPFLTISTLGACKALLVSCKRVCAFS